ncbi:MAG: transglycosylase SLT domain-containing protein [Hyphomicrobiales bacterium]|nr:transglycosylase SLT domain-containing protein [Hyphomicrobiales bacterium]
MPPIAVIGLIIAAGSAAPGALAHSALAAPAAPDALCLMLESAARANGLPPTFFARLIWRESRFRPAAVGPVTSSGERAQGIAQFMPKTAAERRLLDPFNPVLALPKAAEFLRELHTRFGNLGLAAAAYNAGPRRVREWLDGSGRMPLETRNYVRAITGRPIETWIGSKDGWAAAPFDCSTIIARLKWEPTPYVQSLERRIEASATRPWAVQLAAGFSRESVLAAYQRAIVRFGHLFDRHDPIISKALVRSRGTRALIQARVGADTRAQADTLCARLRQSGGACMVLRQRPAAAGEK